MGRVPMAACAIAALAVVVLIPGRLNGATAAAPNTIAFETPTIVDPFHTNGQPDIAIDPQRRGFNSRPTGTRPQRSTWVRSIDGGHSLRASAQHGPPAPMS